MESTPKSSSSSSSNLFAELPREKWWGILDLHQWEGSWYYLPLLEAAMAVKSGFQACDDDILLASIPKTGSTWLKALIPTIINRNGDDSHDALIKSHPNALMPSLEVQIFRENSNPDLSGMLSPRLFRTHVPYAMLSESIKKSKCKIVYITRDPKDTFVSQWHFVNTNMALPTEEMSENFKSFCKGLFPFGPFHDPVLGYWQESLKCPEKVLFLKYEEMIRDTRGQVKRLASFLGRPFVNEEELDKVIWKCSLQRLKKLEVNKNGIDPWDGFAHTSYFRLGVVGDWKNNLTTEMKEQLDDITSKKLHGFGLLL